MPRPRSASASSPCQPSTAAAGAAGPACLILRPCHAARGRSRAARCRAPCGRAHPPPRRGRTCAFPQGARRACAPGRGRLLQRGPARWPTCETHPRQQSRCGRLRRVRPATTPVRPRRGRRPRARLFLRRPRWRGRPPPATLARRRVWWAARKLAGQPPDFLPCAAPVAFCPPPHRPAAEPGRDPCPPRQTMFLDTRPRRAQPVIRPTPSALPLCRTLRTA